MQDDKDRSSDSSKNQCPSANPRIVNAGLHTLVVDQGRSNSRGLGVPVGGAADRFALSIGNALVGNPPNTAALEMTLAGPRITTDADLACVVYGAPFELTSNRQRLRAGTTFTLHSGEELHIGGTDVGLRAYFCVRGGFDVPFVLGSRSALAPLKAGDNLHCRSSTSGRRFVYLANEAEGSSRAGDGKVNPLFFASPFPFPSSPRLLRVLAGPQCHWFDPRDFYSQEFAVLPESNRMGLRLRGQPLTMPEQEMVSEPVCPGAVQVTRDGQCIVLGVDGQTIGGYPKIAQVISADLDWIGQLRAGESIRFVEVDLQQATRFFRQRQAELEKWVARLQCTLAD